MDDDEDPHQPSSPLSRSFDFHIGSSAIAPRRRRSKTPGDEDDDEDDAVNPSPLVARRRAQYKSRVSSTGRLPVPSSSPAPTSSPPIAALFSNRNPRRPGEGEDDPRRAFLRDRFKKQYFENATRKREEAVKARRRHMDGKGKGKMLDGDVGMESDEEESVEAIMNDEVCPLLSLHA